MSSDSIFFLAVAAVIVTAILASRINTEPSVIYVGTQCQGASEIAVARTAMDLPPCASIEIHQVAEGASQ